MVITDEDPMAPGTHRLAARDVVAPVDRRVFVVAGAMWALLMVFSNRYGFHRDELYFLDCARHLSASYVDQPVLTPLVAWLSLKLFGVSVVGLRVWSALAAFASVVLGGLLARELGGGRTAQLVGALGVATAPAYLGADHLLETTSFDLLAWLALALILVRIGRTGRTQLFVPAGVVLGLGLANKHSIGFFALAVVVGVLLSRGGRIFCNRSFVAGALIAVLFTIPDLWWQATHGWATVDMSRSLTRENGGLGNGISFVFAQLFMASPVLIPIWILGVRSLWRSDVALWRAMAWSYGMLIVFFAATSGAKPYYVAAFYPVLIAAGAVVAEQRWSAAGVERRRVRTYGVLLALCTLITLPMTLPVLPIGDAAAFKDVNTVPEETVGWPQLVQQVSRVWTSLSPAERAHAVIYTANYGEAAAINELGPPEGLPPAVSGHNSEWFWGPGAADPSTVVAVLPGDASTSDVHAVTSLFARTRVAATIHNPWGVSNQEEGGHIYVCTTPMRPWSVLWPALRHYD